MSVKSKQNYPYAVGRIRAIEKNLLTPAKLEVLIGAATIDEAVKILTDSGYKTEGEFKGDYESLLKGELSRTYALLKSLVPDSELFNVFLYKNDYHNLKVLLKEELKGVDSEDALYETGSVSLKELKDAYLNRRLEDISPIMAKAIDEAFDIYAKTGDFQLADIIIDNGAFAEMVQAAQKSGNAFVMDIIKAQIDFTNIKTRIRVEKMGKDAAFWRMR